MAAGITVLCLISISKTSYAETLPKNIVPNPSFEEGTSSPDGWTVSEKSSCLPSSNPEPMPTFAWDSSVGYSGTRSLAIKGITLPSGFHSVKGSWTTDFIPTQIQRYDGTAKIKGAEYNINLKGHILMCHFNEAGTPIELEGAVFASSAVGNTWTSLWGRNGPNHESITKTKIIIGASCADPARSCSGDLWIDDVNVAPSWNVYAHSYHDLNTNQTLDSGEPNLSNWQFYLYKGKDCQGTPFGSKKTDSSGIAEFNFAPFGGIYFGEYSLREVSQIGWHHSSPFCQNFTTEIGQGIYLKFGHISHPFVYFSQKDPVWGQNEYDHASTNGPFTCGTTIAECGCATTAAAMLLNSHGATKSPTGEPTNPHTLNNWLAQNNGYTFGTVKWPSVAAYSVAANAAFGTQKIKFNGWESSNPSQPVNDLAYGNPVILEQPGHFVLSTGYFGFPFKYNIADPAYEENTTLDSYGNTYLSARRFEKTQTDLSTIYITTPAPTEIFLVDESGKRLGKDPETGTVYNEFTNAYYIIEPIITNPNEATTASQTGITTLVIQNPTAQNYSVKFWGADNYDVDFSSYDKDGGIRNQIFSDLSGEEGFDLSYSPESGAPSTVSPQTIGVDIHIFPGILKNLKKMSVIPVVVLSSADFDTAQIDPEAVELGPAGASPLFQGDKIDINHDGRKDLMLLFKKEHTGITESDTEICINGETFDGKSFLGCHALIP